MIVRRGMGISASDFAVGITGVFQGLTAPTNPNAGTNIAVMIAAVVGLILLTRRS